MIRYSENENTAKDSNNWYDKEDNYGCFWGIYFDIEDGTPGLSEYTSTEGFSNEELNDEWLPALSKFIEETA